ncbi:MAG TPA: ATP-binding protein [Thermoanaerobaculia bacterium]|nr:ATP-binding protein [Thermoanaerobaculia bacterium]
MIARHAAARLREALADRPVVLLHGARQSGKTTLVRALAEADHPARYVTFDALTELSAARGDPAGFLAGIEGPVVLDEVQRVPDLFVAIKEAVDRDRRPGQFLLTGSANVLLVPRLSDSLAGRMEIVTLWPLSQGEVEGVVEGFVDAMFDDAPPTPGPPKRGVALAERIMRGGFPEAAAMTANRRSAWFDAYLTTILGRDVRDLANIEGLTELPHLLALVAARPMALLNYAELVRSSGLTQSTLKRYFALLEAVFLLRTLRPWHGNLGKRLVKSPKVLLCDSGLAAHLMGVDDARLAQDRALFGKLLEGFVAMEITKQTGWSAAQPSLYHFRTHEGDEVDLVLELRSGTLAGIEVKSAATVTGADFKGLRTLSEAAGRKFHRGVVLYAGKEVVPFGPRLYAVPVEALWRWGADPTTARSLAKRNMTPRRKRRS